MPQDSIYITYHDTTYVYNGPGSLPNGLDTNPDIEALLNLSQKYPTNEKLTGSKTPDLYLPFIFLPRVVAALFYRIKRPNLVASNANIVTNEDERTNYQFQTFYGSSLQFSSQLLHEVLIKHFTYYTDLCISEQKRFLKRLELFMETKCFTVPYADGYREMPILISASAIQLTFGLNDFMLPWYSNICVQKQEYWMPDPLRAVAGNVTGNTITLSWKHYLEGNRTKDGENVGLHEMAHALQMQHEHFYKRKGAKFREVYDSFELLDEEVRQKANTKTNILYTNYALSNTDEFWASSVEIFFEKPTDLNIQYPAVYQVISRLLKQDPITSTSNPCIIKFD